MILRKAGMFRLFLLYPEFKAGKESCEFIRGRNCRKAIKEKKSERSFCTEKKSRYNE